MTDSLEPSAIDERLEREKLAAMKELAYGASHEINNPLANIAARAQTLIRDEQQPDRRRALESIHQQAMRAHEMISDLMLFARPPEINPESTDLVALVERVIESYAIECERRRVRMALNSSAPFTNLHVDRQQLEVAVSAVCRNALEAIGEDGAIEISLSESDSPARNVVVEISDTGPGISDEVRRHLFDPFYSGREAGRGLGFGMSKCWRIITDHGGTVTVDSSLGEGTTISLHIPADAPPAGD